MRISKLIVGVALLVFVGACGKSSPTEPSSAAGATVNGNIVTGGGGASIASLSAAMPASVPPGLTVAVANTNINSAVDAAGNFTLKEIPSGNANLQFIAPGLSAQLGLSDLQNGETLSIQVSLTSTSATLESSRRSAGSQQQLEGKVQSLPPTTAAGVLEVAGVMVTTDANTLFWLRGQAASFTDLALGQRVHVKGQSNATGLLASQVNIQNTNTDVGLNYNGVVSGFTGLPTAFEFTVNGQLIKGDAATEFYGNSQFLELVDGVTVEVKGSQRSGFVYASRIHVNIEEIEVTGALSSKTGTAPNLTLIVGGTTVKTSSATDLKQKGNVLPLSALTVGQTLQVNGGLLPDGTVIARKIQIK